MLRPLIIAFALLVVVLAAGCGGDATKADFRQDVLAARNDTDAGLAQIVQATSAEDLLARMRVAASEVRGAATDVREADAPAELADERDALAYAGLANAYGRLSLYTGRPPRETFPKAREAAEKALQ